MYWIWIVFAVVAGTFVLALVFMMIKRFFYLRNLEAGSGCKFWANEVAFRGTITEVQGTSVLIDYMGSVYKRPITEITWP